MELSVSAISGVATKYLGDSLCEEYKSYKIGITRRRCYSPGTKFDPLNCPISDVCISPEEQYL